MIRISSRRIIPKLIINMAAGNIAIKYGARGESKSVVTACATSTHSVGDAYRLLKHGYLDIYANVEYGSNLEHSFALSLLDTSKFFIGAITFTLSLPIILSPIASIPITPSFAFFQNSNTSFPMGSYCWIGSWWIQYFRRSYK